MITLGVSLEKFTRTYREGETLKGAVILQSKTETKHDGLDVLIDGRVTVHMPPKAIGIADVFAAGKTCEELISKTIPILKPSKLSPGRFEYPFELQLTRPSEDRPLLHTYHGVYMTVRYLVNATLRRSFPHKSSQDVTEFMVLATPIHVQSVDRPLGSQMKFTAESGKCMNVKNASSHNGVVPKFFFEGVLQSNTVRVDDAIRGSLDVIESTAELKSIDMQILRVETCEPNISKDRTEIQTLQLAEGDVRDRSVPIYMLLPRLFVCPTVTKPQYSIATEINLVFTFANDLAVYENLPVVLVA